MVDGRTAGATSRRAALVVPVKSFAEAKHRLAPHLDRPTRAALAQAMAERVLAARGGLSAVIVCDDEAVRSWARSLGADVVWTPGLGLNGAVEAGLAAVAEQGFDRAVVAHADLPLAEDLSWLTRYDGVVLVPDRHRDGTNVIGLPTGAGFRFAYGPGSFGRHQAEAARLGLPRHEVADERLGWDVDVVADLGVAPPLHLPATVTAVLGGLLPERGPVGGGRAPVPCR